MKEKESSRLGEVFKFLISGGICAVVEFVLLVALRDGLGMDTLLAQFFAFLVSVAVNYLFAVLWIWPSARENNGVMKAGFLITSLMGLVIKELFMWIFRMIFGEEQVLFTVMGKSFSMYMLNFCITTVIVMFWNFFTKRAVLHSEWLKKLTKKA